MDDEDDEDEDITPHSYVYTVREIYILYIDTSI